MKVIDHVLSQRRRHQLLASKRATGRLGDQCVVGAACAARCARCDLTQAIRPLLTLRTLGRGDGLLGMMGFGAPPKKFAPRGDSVTVAQLHCENAESHALAKASLRSLGLQPLPPASLQWRGDDLTLGSDSSASTFPSLTMT